MTSDILTSFAVAGFYVLIVAAMSIALWFWLGRLRQRLARQREKRAVAHGERGLVRALALYRERVVDVLSQTAELGPLGAFSFDRMYVPLELEVRPIGDQSATRGQPEEVVARHRRVAILGPSGGGKTTMLHHLELLSARGHATGIPDLPVFVSLAQLGVSSGGLVDCARRVLEDPYGIFITRDDLEASLEAGVVLLLLDGVDELGPGSTRYAEALEEIRNLSRKYPKSPVVLSCRTAAWAAPLAGFREASIPPLDVETIRRFIVARFPPEDGDRVERLYRIISGSRALMELAETPLLLALIIALHSTEGRLPRSRLELYQQCSDLLIYQWDAVRDLKRPTEIPKDLKYQLLKRLALHLQREQVAAISDTRLMAQVAEWLPPGKWGDPRQIIDEIEIAHGILVRHTRESYAFLHLVFQQYFAAKELADERPLPEYLFGNLFSPWWSEVIVLLCAMDRADEIVPSMLQQLDGAEGDDHNAWVLVAAECVRASSYIDPSLRNEVADRLKRMLWAGDPDPAYQAAMALAGLGRQQAEYFLETALSSYHTSVQAVAAALGLVELGRSEPEIVDTLITALSDHRVETRARAAQALSRLASRDVLDPLLHSLMGDESPLVRAEVLRAINSIVEVPELDTETLASTIKALRAARQDSDPVVSELAGEILSRLSLRLQDWGKF